MESAIALFNHNQDLEKLEGVPGQVLEAAFFDRDRLATVGTDGVTRMWDISARKQLYAIEDHKAPRRPLQNSQQFGKPPVLTPKSLQREFGKKCDDNSARNSYTRHAA